MNIKKITKEDKQFVTAVLRNFWGSDTIIVRNNSYKVETLLGFLAEENKRPVGLITYTIKNKKILIISLNSLIPGKGIGTALLEKVQEEGKMAGYLKIIVVTTNDNIKAQEFYKKRGFIPTAMYKNSIKKARLIKPEIPEIGENGIPITDEIELTLSL